MAVGHAVTDFVADQTLDIGRPVLGQPVEQRSTRKRVFEQKMCRREFLGAHRPRELKSPSVHFNCDATLVRRNDRESIVVQQRDQFRPAIEGLFRLQMLYLPNEGQGMVPIGLFYPASYQFDALCVVYIAGRRPAFKIQRFLQDQH